MRILLFLPIGDQLMNQSYERVWYLAFPFFSYYNSLQHILLEVRCDVRLIVGTWMKWPGASVS
jgi:uncharacterized membrane protein